MHLSYVLYELFLITFTYFSSLDLFFIYSLYYPLVVSMFFKYILPGYNFLLTLTLFLALYGRLVECSQIYQSFPLCKRCLNDIQESLPYLKAIKIVFCIYHSKI